MNIILRMKDSVALTRDDVSDEYQVFVKGEFIYGNEDYENAALVYISYTEDTIFKFDQEQRI